MEPGEYDTLARLEGQHWWYVGMRRIAVKLLRSLSLRSPIKILDAGCGVGGGLKWLASFGATTGIDLNPSAVRYAARVSGRVAQSSIQSLPFPAEVFDLVTSFEVLYHLAVSNDEAALCECARVLKPGGWMLVRVPAYDWLRGAHDIQVHTRHRYAGRELRQKMERAGLIVCRLTHVGLALLPVAILRRSIQSIQPVNEAHTDVTMPPAIFNKLLMIMLSAEGAWLRHFDFPFGLSLLALARKLPES